MNTNEHRIREFAYQIWESEGRPHGQEERHWDMACKLADAHDDVEDQQQAALVDADETFAANEISPKKPRSKTKSADPSPAMSDAIKSAKTKKSKSTTEISA
jgi:hypothetical protein